VSISCEVTHSSAPRPDYASLGPFASGVKLTYACLCGPRARNNFNVIGVILYCCIVETR